MFSNYILLIVILAAGMFYSIFFKKLTVGAAIAGAVIGLIIFIGAGYTGIAMMTAFFVLGSATTSWKIKTKQQLGLSELNKGKRTASQVIANASAAALLGVLAWLYPQQKNVFTLMMASAFSSATADTVSSELGNIYGSKFYNIITFKKDKRGLNGVVSLEGTLFGIAGSFIIAMIYNAGFGWHAADITIIVFSGTVGNIADSITGATAERKKWLNNNAVNFLNTIVAAITALIVFCTLF